MHHALMKSHCRPNLLISTLKSMNCARPSPCLWNQLLLHSVSLILITLFSSHPRMFTSPIITTVTIHYSFFIANSNSPLSQIFPAYRLRLTHPYITVNKTINNMDSLLNSFSVLALFVCLFSLIHVVD